MTDVERTLEKVEDGMLHIKTVRLEEHNYAASMKALADHEANLMKINKGLDEFKAFIDRRGWEDELAELEHKREETLVLIGIFKKGLEGHLNDLTAKGRQYIHAQKASRKYLRTPEGETKTVLRVQILNDCRAMLGITDIASPVMLQLREEFEKI